MTYLYNLWLDYVKNYDIIGLLKINGFSIIFSIVQNKK